MTQRLGAKIVEGSFSSLQTDVVDRMYQGLDIIQLSN